MVAGLRIVHDTSYLLRLQTTAPIARIAVSPRTAVHDIGIQVGAYVQRNANKFKPIAASR